MASNNPAQVSILFDLMMGKRGDCEITPSDRVHLGEDIDRKLDEGWTVAEVREVLQWTEYFNNEDPEEYCLERMSEVYARVKARLAQPRGSFIPLLILTHITDERGVDYCVKLTDSEDETKLIVERPDTERNGPGRLLMTHREFYKGEAVRRAAQEFYMALVKIAAQMEEEARNA